MYKLTNNMVQALERDLKKFHDLFQGGRCQAWQLEELIAKAIRSDFGKSDTVIWKGNGHDIGCDIVVNDDRKIQIKSGVIKNGKLILSGHRLGRFKGDLGKITEFLNNNQYLLIAVPYILSETEEGRCHTYQIFYLETNMLGIEDVTKWRKTGSKYVAVNDYGVELSVSPSMSWQVWWQYPVDKIPESNKTRQLVIK